MNTPHKIRVKDVKPGMSLNTHQDVFFDVVSVSESPEHPGNLVIECVHGTYFTYAPDWEVTILNPTVTTVSTGKRARPRRFIGKGPTGTERG